MSEDMDWLLSPFWYQKLDVQLMGIMFEIAPMCRAASKGCCNLFSCFSSPNVTFLRKRAHSQILERYPRGNFALKGSWELNFCFKTETKVCCLSKLLCQSIQDTACLSHSLLNSLWIQICILMKSQMCCLNPISLFDKSIINEVKCYASNIKSNKVMELRLLNIPITTHPKPTL